MSIPQLSPVSLSGNPAHHNPLAHAFTSAAAAGALAHRTTEKGKSDSVNISREALSKADQTSKKSDDSKETLSQSAPEKTRSA